ncbi:hypothetical protein LCGC14_2767730, partial [marine sediment metagenome]
MEKIDVIGKKFGKLTVVKEDIGRPGKRRYLVCECDCGNFKSIRKYNLTNGQTTSCGCFKKERKISLIGQRFGFIEVTQSVSSKNKRTMWLCRCDCGKFKEIRAHSLRRGMVKSCGCQQQEGNRLDLKNKRFGRLVVLEKRPNRNGRTRWLCHCDCGSKKEIDTRHIVNEYGTNSCGCLLKEYNKKHQLKKGRASLNKLFRTYVRRAKNKGLKFNLNFNQFQKLTEQDCHYCGSVPSSVISGKTYYGDYTYNGIDRVDNNKGYDLD